MLAFNGFAKASLDIEFPEFPEYATKAIYRMPKHLRPKPDKKSGHYQKGSRGVKQRESSAKWHP